ncbi:hypothetical protein BaRGS_00009465, partial [Batillaria attramentaria]
PPSTTYDALALTQNRMAVSDEKGELHVRLTCGTFTDLGQPPVEVVWKVRTERVQGFTWNDNVGADLRTCVGEQFQFEWSYTLDNTDMEISKNWMAVLNGQTVQLMLERPTEFLFEASGGLTLRSASLAHSGSYSLTVNVMVITTAGNMETMKYERSANLTVAEPPRTNGTLQVTQVRKAIYDNHTSMWHVTLSCGQFVSLGHPAIDVVWQ